MAIGFGVQCIHCRLIGTANRGATSLGQMADIIRFADYGPRYRPVVHNEESALIIVLPVIRIERYAVEYGGRMAGKTEKQRQRLRRHIGKTED